MRVAPVFVSAVAFILPSSGLRSQVEAYCKRQRFHNTVPHLEAHAASILESVVKAGAG